MANPLIQQKISLDDFAQLDSDKYYEVIDGELQDNTIVAGFYHATIIANLYNILKPFARQHGLGYVYQDGLTYILALDSQDNVLAARIPDVSFVRPHKIPSDWDRKRPFPVPPDLAVEVVSPTETSATLMGKISDYLHYGTEEVWAIYPERQELHRYRRDDNIVTIYKAAETLQAASLFPNLLIKIADLFVDEYE